jgi:hypothetical protein
MEPRSPQSRLLQRELPFDLLGVPRAEVWCKRSRRAGFRGLCGASPRNSNCSSADVQAHSHELDTRAVTIRGEIYFHALFGDVNGGFV